jgi:hypothetical protein
MVVEGIELDTSLQERMRSERREPWWDLEEHRCIKAGQIKSLSKEIWKELPDR